jgi:ubiquitin thioesterase protein OTUB1
MKRDGNCGWRAVAFGYFESLFNLHNLIHAQSELVRIKGLNSLLDQVGHQEHLYEIFVDATESVFEQVCEAIQAGVRDDSFLKDLFNEEFNSSAVITHFRVSSTPVDACLRAFKLTAVLPRHSFLPAPG